MNEGHAAWRIDSESTQPNVDWAHNAMPGQAAPAGKYAAEGEEQKQVMHSAKWNMPAEHFYPVGVELLGRIGPRGKELIDRLVSIVYDAKKAAVGAGAPRERTSGWLRRSLVGALSLAIQRGNADVMCTQRLVCHLAGAHQRQAGVGEGDEGAVWQPAMAVTQLQAAPAAGGGVA